MERYLLDTHVWIWLQEGDRTRLKRSAIEQARGWHGEARLGISAISAWEIANLASLGRLQLSVTIDGWMQHALDDPALTLYPLDVDTLIEATRLPGTIHRDPADRMLVATARQHNLTLLTRDEDLLRYAREGHVRARKF